MGEQQFLAGTRCDLCDGSGQLAVLYEEFIDRERDRRELRLMKLLQYEALKDYKPPAEWIQFYVRCSCPAGERRPAGTPRWSEDKRYIVSRISGGPRK